MAGSNIRVSMSPILALFWAMVPLELPKLCELGLSIG